MNRILLNGRIATELTVKISENGSVWLPFRLKHSEKGNDGKYHNMTVNCVAFGGCAQSLYNSFSKNDPIVIKGKLNHREYTTKEGKKGEKTEILVSTYESATNGLGEVIT